MTHKLSPQKASRIMALYFQGRSQPEIAGRLKVDQSTVSLYVTRFKHLAEEKGLKAAGEEFNMVNEVEALHSLAEELKDCYLTVEEAKAGLKMESLLQKCGIEPEHYKDVLKACVKMNAEGFVTAAVRLSQLEASTGLGYQELVARCESAHEQLGKTEEDLQAVTARLEKAKDELASIEKQNKSAGQNLKAYMDQVGLDTGRLEQVEQLAGTLKKAGASNEELEGFIQRQRLLAKAGIGLDTFAAILQQARVLTLKDKGKELLERLSEYGSLTGALEGLQSEVHSLGKQVQGMEEKTALKGKLDADVAKLAAEKAILEPCVGQLAKKQTALDEIEVQIAGLQEKQDTLGRHIREKEARRDLLAGELETLEQKAAGLRDVDKQIEVASARLAEIRSEIQGAGARWEIFEGLVGFIGSTSLTSAEAFVSSAPRLLDETRKGTYNSDALKRAVLDGLTGGMLKSLVCESCGARFDVDKPHRRFSDYECPACHLSYSVKVDRDALQILTPSLAPPQRVIVLKAQPHLKATGPTVVYRLQPSGESGTENWSPCGHAGAEDC
ncbi:MAG: hypothetical protein ABIG98_03235 [Chloroflexota bacterium]